MSSKSSKKKGGQQNQQIPVSIPQLDSHQQQQQQYRNIPTPVTSGQAAILTEPDPAKRWRTIYPQYINSNLTVECGRRLAKSKCVSCPLAEEIFNVLAASPQQFEVQLNMRKCYCREIDKENIRNRGYIKYRLLNNEQFKNKKQLLIYVASMIPKLKSRQNPKPATSGQDGGGGNPSNNPSGSSSTGNKAAGNAGQPQSGATGGGGGGGKKKNRRK